MVGTVIIVVIAILIPVAILAYFSHQRRSHERAALEDLWENYSNQGVDASVLPEDSPEALEQGEGSQKLVRFFFGGDIGYIQVKGLNYDLVTVRLALAPRSTSSVNIAGYHSTKQEIPISYHYIVPTRTVDDQTLRARLKKETKGLLRRELVAVAWRGGRLADLLNSEPELNTLIASLLTPKDDIKVEYDRKHAVTRIVLTLRAEVRRKGFLLFLKTEFNPRLPSAQMADAINRIGGLVRQDTPGGG